MMYLVLSVWTKKMVKSKRRQFNENGIPKHFANLGRKEATMRPR
jgi:hypothetical protein